MIGPEYVYKQSSKDIRRLVMIAIIPQNLRRQRDKKLFLIIHDVKTARFSPNLQFRLIWVKSNNRGIFSIKLPHFRVDPVLKLKRLALVQNNASLPRLGDSILVEYLGVESEKGVDNFGENE